MKKILLSLLLTISVPIFVNAQRQYFYSGTDTIYIIKDSCFLNGKKYIFHDMDCETLVYKNQNQKIEIMAAPNNSIYLFINDEKKHLYKKSERVYYASKQM